MYMSPFVYTMSIPIQSPQIPIQTSNFPYVFITTPYMNFSTTWAESQQNPMLKHRMYVESTQKLSTQQNRLPREIQKITSNFVQFPQKLQQKQKNKIERLRDGKGRYYGIRKLSSKEKYKQNPKRNVITNIGNQLLAFASNRSRSEGIIKKMKQQITQEQLSSFYQFMIELRSTTDYYLNINKMKNLWHPTSTDAYEFVLKNRSLFRMISYYYLNNMIHLFVLNSAKIKKSCKIFHIKAIRALLKQLTVREI